MRMFLLLRQREKIFLQILILSCFLSSVSLNINFDFLFSTPPASASFACEVHNQNRFRDFGIFLSRFPRDSAISSEYDVQNLENIHVFGAFQNLHFGCILVLNSQKIF